MKAWVRNTMRITDAWPCKDKNEPMALALKAGFFAAVLAFSYGLLLLYFSHEGQDLLTGWVALALPIALPMATRACFARSGEHPPRSGDFLALALLFLPASCIAALLWGSLDILALCGVGLALGLACHGLLLLEWSWGMAPFLKPAVKGKESPAKLPLNWGNGAKALVQAAVSPLKDAYLLMLLFMSHRAPARETLASLFTLKALEYSLFFASMLFVIRLGKNLKAFFIFRNGAVISLAYGLLAYGVAARLAALASIDDPLIALIIGFVAAFLLFASLDKAAPGDAAEKNV